MSVALCTITAAPEATTATTNAISGSVISEPPAVTIRVRSFSRLPLGCEDGPHDVVADRHAVVEPATQHPVSRRPQLFENAVAPFVRCRRHALRVGRRRARENTASSTNRAARTNRPVPQKRFAESEAPFRRREVALNRPDLNHADGARPSGGDDAEARELAATALCVCPPNKSSKPAAVDGHGAM